MRRYQSTLAWVPVLLVAMAVLASPTASRAQYIFAPATLYGVGVDPRDVTCADVNGDGKLDLISANAGSGNLSVLLNNSNGSFGAASFFDVGSMPYAVVAARMNDDVYPDLVASNLGSDNFSVLLNDGTGTFAPAVDYAVGDSPMGIVAKDLNGDNRPDVAVVNHEEGTVEVLLNNGDGTLTFDGIYASGGAYTNPSWLCAADFEGDGDLDLAVVKNYHNLYFNAAYLDLFLNDGAGGFSYLETIDLGRTATTPVPDDFNGDGHVDLIVSGFVANSYKISILLNDGYGRFEDPVFHYAGADGRAASGDFDFDQDRDLAVTMQGVGSGGFSVLINNGDATFDDAFTRPVGPYPMGLTIGDFDADGDDDVSVAIFGADAVSVSMNTTNPTGVVDPEADGAVSDLVLYQNHPNPFGPATSMSFSLLALARVSVRVHDVSGRLVRTLVDDETRGAGQHRASWDGTDERGKLVAAGVYFYSVETDSEMETKRMVLLR